MPPVNFDVPRSDDWPVPVSEKGAVGMIRWACLSSVVLPAALGLVLAGVQDHRLQRQPAAILPAGLEGFVLAGSGLAADRRAGPCGRDPSA